MSDTINRRLKVNRTNQRLQVLYNDYQSSVRFYRDNGCYADNSLNSLNTFCDGHLYADVDGVIPMLSFDNWLQHPDTQYAITLDRDWHPNYYD